MVGGVAPAAGAITFPGVDVSRWFPAAGPSPPSSLSRVGREVRPHAATMLLLALAATACEGLSGGSVVVRDGWTRESVDLGGALGAGAAVYLTLENRSRSEVVVVGATSPDASVVSLMDVGLEEGLLRARPMDSLRLEPGAARSLQPGGGHLRLIGLRKPLTAGDTLLLTLRLADGRSVEARAHVRPRL